MRARASPAPGTPLEEPVPPEQLAERLGLAEHPAQDVGELVRLHLELIETATRIDLDDEDAILAAAARIGDRRLVAPLHLLTAADSRRHRAVDLEHLDRDPRGHLGLEARCRALR